MFFLIWMFFVINCFFINRFPCPFSSKVKFLYITRLDTFSASLVGNNSPLQIRENMYLLAVGYYRSGDYSRSRQLVGRCLEVRYVFTLHTQKFVIAVIYLHQHFCWIWKDKKQNLFASDSFCLLLYINNHGTLYIFSMSSCLGAFFKSIINKGFEIVVLVLSFCLFMR